MRYPDSLLTVRNLCDGGDTPGFRPHSSRNDPWAFPGAEKFQLEFAKNSGSEGHLEKHDVWLSRLKTDIIIAFFAGSCPQKEYKHEYSSLLLNGEEYSFCRFLQ